EVYVVAASSAFNRGGSVATKKQKKRARAKMEVRKASEGPLSTPPACRRMCPPRSSGSRRGRCAEASDPGAGQLSPQRERKPVEGTAAPWARTRRFAGESNSRHPHVGWAVLQAGVYDRYLGDFSATDAAYQEALSIAEVLG